MVMTNEEIVRDYLQARNKSKQIRILADLNQTTKAEIRQILASEGAEVVEANKRPLKPLMMDYLHEMGRLMVEDARDDPGMVYTKETVDRRLRKICGEKFEPWEVRYQK